MMSNAYPRREYRGFIGGCYVIHGSVEIVERDGVIMWSIPDFRVVSPKAESTEDVGESSDD